MLLETLPADTKGAETPDDSTSLTGDEISWLRRLCQENFYFFAKFVLEFPFEKSWLQKHIHKPICDALQDYTVNKRVTIVLPRAWLKSTLCSVYYPIWRAIRDPSIRVLIVQNTTTNAEKKLGAIREQFDKNALLRLLFAELLPDASSTWTTKGLCLKRPMGHPESTFEAAGTRTGLTSRHYNLIIEDDTVAPDLDDFTSTNVTPSKDDIEQAIGFHRSVTGLLNDYNDDQILIVGTRWYEHDLISWNAQNQSYLRIERAVRETDGKPDVKGKPSYPERFHEETLKGLEKDWGPYLFSCLYMNRPLSSTDMIFKKEWFLFYADAPRNLLTYTTVDPAGGGIGGSKKAKTAANLDFNVVMTCGKNQHTGELFVLDYDRFQGTPGDLINKVFEHQKRYSSLIVGIEGQHYQNSLDYFVKEQMKLRSQFFHIEMLKSVKSKETRIRALQPLFASGSIKIRTHHVDLMGELEAFPLAAHDDVVDALSMQLQLLELTTTSGESWDGDGSEDPMSLESALVHFQIQSEGDPNDLVGEMLFSENESSTLSTFNPKRNLFSDISEETWHTDLIV